MPRTSSSSEFSPFVPTCAATLRISDHPSGLLAPPCARRRSACDAERSRSAPERTTHAPAPRAFPAQDGDSRGPGGQTEVLQERARTARTAGPTGSMANHTSQPNGMQGLRQEHLYKVLVIGDLGVGKTSIIRRYVHQTYSSNYRATIGVDFALKVLNWDSETVRLQLWDIAGTAGAGSK